MNRNRTCRDCGKEIMGRKQLCEKCRTERAFVSAVRNKLQIREAYAAKKTNAQALQSADYAASEGYKPPTRCALDNVIAKMEEENTRRRAAGLPTLTYGKFIAELKV